MQASGIKKEFRSAVLRLEEVPLMSLSEQRLLVAATDNEIDIASLVALIEECPVVAARIVGLANAAFFGQTVPVRSISDAIIRVIGLNLVKCLIMGITTTGVLKTGNCPQFNLQKHWHSTLLTAMLARLLTPLVQVGKELAPDNSYLCGLLHSLGMLALVHIAPGEMDSVFTTVQKHPQHPLIEIETEILGVHHGQAGALLAFRWHLPDEVRLVMEHHVDPNYRGREWSLSLLVGQCACWTEQLLSGSDDHWEETESAVALGISPEDLRVVKELWLQRHEELADLAKLFVGR
jgi:HD-like signal output (HDOD) protein